MKISIPYSRQWIDEDDIRAVVKVLKSDWITQGPKIDGFEKLLCDYCGVKYAVVVSSGTAALHLACFVAEIKPEDEVITSPITFVASANCILYCGGKPVFADIQQDTTNINPLEIRKKITKKTKAIIPVHFAGHPCDLEEISNLSKKHNLMVIEDAAHALGAEYKGLKIGSCKYSDMTVFSFHPVKSITTGEGGVVLTNRKELYEKLCMFRNHGITRDRSKLRRFDGPWYYEMQKLGLNYRITDFQCALGISQLKKLNKFIKRRRDIAKIYNNNLLDIKEITLPVERNYVKSAWHLYTMKIKNKKEKLFSCLINKGIGVQVHYIPAHLQPYYRKKFGYKKGDCPISETYYQRAISLPIYPKLTDEEIKKVINTVKDCLNVK